MKSLSDAAKKELKTVYGTVAGPFTQDDLVHIADEMQNGGWGGFIASLGLALQRADIGNQKKLVLGFEADFQGYLERWESRNPDYYDRLAKLYKEKFGALKGALLEIAAR